MAASQFELKEHHASIANVNNRIQRHGEERQLAADIKFNLSAPNYILDAFDPSLRKDLFRKPNRGEQQDLPHIGGDGLTEVKHTCLEPLKLNHEFTGYELQIDGHLDGTEPIVLVDVKLKKFVATPREGGSVDLSFTASAEIDSAEAAELTEAFLREDIRLSLSRREKTEQQQTDLAA